MKNDFFVCLSRALPRLKTLEVSNQITNPIIEFRHLNVLILHDIHVDYTEQFLSQSSLPFLIELIIRNNVLSMIIDRNNQQARKNCSKIETLQIVEPWIAPSNIHLEFFPRLHRRTDSEN